jgi:DNA-binding transcriptional MerR regulator
MTEARLQESSEGKKPLFTAGELARAIGVTLRTVHHYENKGLLKPRQRGAGGRRLYGPEELVILHQINSFKMLGFSLTDIKEKMESLDSAEKVVEMLEDQAASIKEKMAVLQDQERILEALQEEVTKRPDVNFSRYADIIACLKSGNDVYWALTHLDDDIRSRLRANGLLGEGVDEAIQSLGLLRAKALRMLDEEVCPKSPEGIALGKDWWEITLECVGGDMDLLGDMSRVMSAAMNEDKDVLGVHQRSFEFLSEAMYTYMVSEAENDDELARQLDILAKAAADSGAK